VGERVEALEVGLPWRVGMGSGVLLRTRHLHGMGGMVRSRNLHGKSPCVVFLLQTQTRGDKL